MKKVFVSIVTLTAALILASGAQAQTTPGWYSAGGAGIAVPQDPTFFQGGARVEGTHENFAFSIYKSTGYAFDNGLRLEAEYYYNKVDAKTVNHVVAGGHVSNHILFANAFYDFETKSNVSPYIGAGFGADFVDVSKVGTAAARLDGSKFVGAYQAIVGASAQLDPNWAVTADYRYIASFDPKVDYTGGTKGRISNASQNVMVGLRYSFGAKPPQE